jgi:hypothetical protein
VGPTARLDTVASGAEVKTAAAARPTRESGQVLVGGRVALRLRRTCDRTTGLANREFSRPA